MKTASWIIGLLFVAISSYLILMALFEQPPISTSSHHADSVNIVQRFDEKGRLKSDAAIVKGTYHGLAHNYYSSGKIHSTINYVKGQKDGISTWFFENGKPYRETPFKDGKIDGIQRKYYDNGKLMAEIPYINDELQEGTKEYNKAGSVIAFNNCIIVNVENKTSQLGKVFIDFKLEKTTAKDDYYGVVQQDGNMVKIAAIKIAHGFSRITLISQKEKIENRKIVLIAVSETKQGNKFALTKEMNITLGQ